MNLNLNQTFIINVVLDISFQSKNKTELLNVKGLYYIWVLCGIGRSKAVNILYSFVLEDESFIIDKMNVF